MLTYAACQEQLKRHREMEAGLLHTNIRLLPYNLARHRATSADVVVMFITDNYALDSASNVSLYLSFLSLDLSLSHTHSLSLIIAFFS